MMQFKWITPDSPEYHAERILRWEVLSKPFGIPPSEEVTDEERQSLHLIVLHGKCLVGCVCFHPEGTSMGRIFEMAISEEYRGRGFGRQLLHTLEHMLIQQGIHDVYLFAPPDTEKFYSLLGYQSQEEVRMYGEVAQRRMKKNLKVNSVDEPKP